jgi:hypothetical protein
MITLTVLAFTALAQQPAPCGTRSNPCYTRSAPDMAEPHAVDDLNQWGAAQARAAQQLHDSFMVGPQQLYITNPTSGPCYVWCGDTDGMTAPSIHYPYCSGCPECRHEHGFETAEWDFELTAVSAIFAAIGVLLGGLALGASRLDKIVAAWRRAEIPKNWWWGWATLLGQVVMMFGLVMLARAMGW